MHVHHMHVYVNINTDVKVHAEKKIEEKFSSKVFAQTSTISLLILYMVYLNTA